jgi:hypothetical protein
MTTRTQFYQLALEANERQANVRDDVLPVPTLDERVNLYLRAVHGNREFTDQERSNARDVLLNLMAAEIVTQVQPAVTEPRDLHPYEAPTQNWQSVQRKETIRVAPIARRHTSILALTTTFGVILVVTAGTLGYRWTYPHIGEVSEPSQQDRVPLPTISPRSLSTRPAASEHVVQIASQRSEADVLAVFRRLQQEQPTLFSQATLSRIELGSQSYSARVGPFASAKDAAAACQALAAADIRCF